MEVPFDVTANQFLTRQAISLSVIKQSAQAEKQVANILEASAENIARGGRGTKVNLFA